MFDGIIEDLLKFITRQEANCWASTSAPDAMLIFTHF